MRHILTALAFALFAAPAMAEDPIKISAEADHVFWCASAFFWLAGDADDVGDATDAELYDRWAGELTETGIAQLKAQNITDSTTIEGIINAYDNAVLEELGTDKARFPIETCQELVKS